jgi:uncharacterized protein DUF6538
MRFSNHLYTSRHRVYYFRFVIPDWLRSIVGRSEIRRSLRTHDPREAIRIAANLSIEVEGLIRDMARKKTTPAFHDLKYLLLKQGNDSIEVKDLTSDPNSPADQELLRTLTQKIKELGTGEGKIIPSSGMTLGELIKQYHADQISQKKWTAKSSEEVKRSLELLTQILGETTDASSISRNDIRTFRDTISKLPANFNKKPKFKGKTVAQILASYKGVGIAGNTVKKHLSWVRALFAWGVMEGRIVSNPAIGLAPKAGERARDTRLPFSNEDCRRASKMTQVCATNDYPGAQAALRDAACELV